MHFKLRARERSLISSYVSCLEPNWVATLTMSAPRNEWRSIAALNLEPPRMHLLQSLTSTFSVAGLVGAGQGGLQAAGTNETPDDMTHTSQQRLRDLNVEQQVPGNWSSGQRAE